MVEESQIPGTAEEIHSTLAQLAVDLQTNKEFLQDEQLKYKRYEVFCLKNSFLSNPFK